MPRNKPRLHFGMWLRVMSISTGMLDGSKEDISKEDIETTIKILKKLDPNDCC